MTVAGQPAVNYTYDNANQLTQITQGSSTVTIAYDDSGRRTSLTLPNGFVTEYGYDLASQLTSLTYKQGGTVIGNLTYDYDKNGRRTQVAGSFARSITPQALSAATYNAANQQLSFGGQTLSYDLNGNLTSDGANTNTRPTDYLFPTITAERVSVAFRRLCRNLGVADFRFHDLRHTAASWLRMSGADIHTVAQLLGHEDLRMAARYQQSPLLFSD